ncbi:MAG: hypothetical protein AB2A00_29060 [Myxococcota bacterium]
MAEPNNDVSRRSRARSSLARRSACTALLVLLLPLPWAVTPGCEPVQPQEALRGHQVLTAEGLEGVVLLGMLLLASLACAHVAGLATHRVTRVAIQLIALLDAALATVQVQRLIERGTPADVELRFPATLAWCLTALMGWDALWCLVRELAAQKPRRN